MALTELQIKHLKPKDKVYRVADADGLAIEVRPTGTKLWRLRYYYQGKGQMLALGKYPATGLSEARKKRDEQKALLASGKHLGREKKAEKLRKSVEGENTFENIARQWFDVKYKKLNKKYAKQNMARMEQHIFPKIGALPITEITIPDVVRVAESIAKHGTVVTAKRMNQIIGQVFRYAAQRALCTHNPAADLRDILPSREEKHHACIHPSELPKLLRAIEARKPDFGKYAMQLLALTFVRTGELIGARWREIDWAKEEWHIPKERMKMKRPHIVPLSTQAMAILQEVQKRTGSKEYVFFSAASADKHISNGTVLMALRRMGYRGHSGNF